MDFWKRSAQLKLTSLIHPNKLEVIDERNEYENNYKSLALIINPFIHRLVDFELDTDMSFSLRFCFLNILHQED